MNEYYRIIAAFIIRMGMYIYPIDKYNIMSFITGYQIDKEFFFSAKIKQYLEENRIKSDSLGMTRQIQKYSDIHNIEWCTAFIQIGLSIIAKEDDKVLQELKIGNRIRGIIYRIKSPIENPWIQDWLSFCNLKEEWFYSLWTEQELDVIRLIDYEVKKYLNRPYNDGNFSEKLLELKDTFEKIK
ncbi:MAG: hypothetical protein E6772_00935 [Dysgonomonas sp.]|nr:hypothetical protein [Dysgonomonas sp.]